MRRQCAKFMIQPTNRPIVTIAYYQPGFKLHNTHCLLGTIKLLFHLINIYSPIKVWPFVYTVHHGIKSFKPNVNNNKKEKIEKREIHWNM